MPDDDLEESNSSKIWLWVLIAIALLAVGGILYLLLKPDATPAQVAVPDVTNQQEAAAKSQVEGDGFVWGTPVREPSDTVAEGAVIKTDPAAGTMKDKGSTVTATISTGKGTVAVPDLAGQTEQQAVTTLTGLGLTVNPTRQQDDNPNYPQGQVTKTDPAAGATVDSKTQVTLFVSTGNVAVPDVTNMPKQQALDTLNAQKLTGNTSEVPSDKAPGTVIAQDQAPGTLVKQGRTINLQIAVAPTTATVPNVSGMSYADAVTALNTAGLTNINRIDDASDQPKDQVLRTDPTTGTEVPFDQQIDVHVSKGPTGNNQGAGPSASPTPKSGA